MANHRIQYTTEELELISEALATYRCTGRDSLILSNAAIKTNKVLLLASNNMTVQGKPLMRQPRHIEDKSRQLDDDDYERITGKKFAGIQIGASRYQELFDKAMSGIELTNEENIEFGELMKANSTL